MVYEHRDDYLYEPFEDWVCTRCCKTISADRPPIFNSDNCSCSEAGTPLNDPHLAAHVTSGIGLNSLHLHVDTPHEAFTYHQPPTIDSDEGSVRTPEGPERRDPCADFLALAPATGLGEAQHRRRASFDEIEVQLDYGLRRYLETMTPSELSYHDFGRRGWLDNEGELAGYMWLRQDTHFMGPTGGGYSIRAAKGSSNDPMRSSDLTGSTGSSGNQSIGIDPGQHIGGWMETSVYDAWPDMLMIDECAIDDDEEDDENDEDYD